MPVEALVVEKIQMHLEEIVVAQEVGDVCVDLARVDLVCGVDELDLSRHQMIHSLVKQIKQQLVQPFSI